MCLKIIRMKKWSVIWFSLSFRGSLWMSLMNMRTRRGPRKVLCLYLQGGSEYCRLKHTASDYSSNDHSTFQCKISLFKSQLMVLVRSYRKARKSESKNWSKIKKLVDQSSRQSGFQFESPWNNRNVRIFCIRKTANDQQFLYKNLQFWTVS